VNTAIPCTALALRTLLFRRELYGEDLSHNESQAVRALASYFRPDPCARTRRASLRVDVVAAGELRLGAARSQVRIVDLSVSGAGIILNLPIAVGQMLSLAINESHDEIVTIRAQVMWRRRKRAGLAFVGVPLRIKCRENFPTANGTGIRPRPQPLSTTPSDLEPVTKSENFLLRGSRERGS
jgi:hypothetical protein